MPRPTFSIKGLMGLVFLVALLLACLRNSSPMLAALVQLCVYATLCVATLGVFAHRGEARLPWLGFAGFGWLAIHFYQNYWSTMQNYPLPNLFTTAIMLKLQPLFNPGIKDPIPLGLSWEPSPEYVHYRHIGQYILILFFASFGATAGRYFQARATALNTESDDKSTMQR